MRTSILTGRVHVESPTAADAFVRSDRVPCAGHRPRAERTRTYFRPEIDAFAPRVVCSLVRVTRHAHVGNRKISGKRIFVRVENADGVSAPRRLSYPRAYVRYAKRGTHTRTLVAPIITRYERAQHKYTICVFSGKTIKRASWVLLAGVKYWRSPVNVPTDAYTYVLCRLVAAVHTWDIDRRVGRYCYATTYRHGVLCIRVTMIDAVYEG